MRLFVAVDSQTSEQLFLCSAAGCQRLTAKVYCCVWCEVNLAFGSDIQRHTTGCDRRRGEAEHVLRLTVPRKVGV
jgi:hypothetical protein